MYLKKTIMKRIFTLLFLVTSITVHVSAQGLVINEVDYDQSSVDFNEFIELYNSGSSAVNLGDYAVLLFNGNSASLAVYDTILLPAQSLNPGGYFVICGLGSSLPNCDLSFADSSNQIQNGSPDAIGIISIAGASFIDALSYEGSCPAPFVEGTGLPTGDSDTIVADTVEGPFISIGRFPDGNDSNNNSVDFARQCKTPGAPNSNSAANCSGTAGINRPSLQNNWMVYPNPSRGMVHFDFGKDALRVTGITIYDILGNELRQIDVNATTAIYSLDLSEYNSGVYFVKVATENGEAMKRIVVKK
jgi:Secretion system C-terminal sorting domain/Lamin Tail Domain